MPQFSKKVGLPPGTPIYVGEKKTEHAKITIIDYDEKHFEEKVVKNVEECFPFKDKPTVTWINIDGLHQVELIETIGRYFNLHPLILEDIVSTSQRPRMEDFENYIFVVLKMIYLDGKENEINIEQVSLIIGENYVISFQEKEGDVFNPIRERIKNGKGRIRKMGADYLAYALTDVIVDNYFVVLEKIDEKLEDLEEELVTNPTSKTLQAIHNLKKDVLLLRKSIWPLREVIGILERGDSKFIYKSTQIYFRDVYDHTIQVMDVIETSLDMLTGMLDIYLSSLNNKMNEIMKVLTIIATIFIPLTFITGIYGMNFKHMPELSWHWGYFAVLLVMAIIGVSMLMYFKKKKWL